MEKVDSIAIESTTMAVREQLMQYFKGTCIENLVDATNVSIRVLPMRSANYSYQRREYDNIAPREICLGGIPILSVQRAPETIVFYSKVLNRSPQLRGVYKGLQDFMEKYLQGIEIKHSRKGVFYAD